MENDNLEGVCVGTEKQCIEKSNKFIKEYKIFEETLASIIKTVLKSYPTNNKLNIASISHQQYLDNLLSELNNKRDTIKTKIYKLTLIQNRIIMVKNDLDKRESRE